MRMQQSYGKQDVFYIHDSIPCLVNAVVSGIPYIYITWQQHNKTKLYRINSNLRPKGLKFDLIPESDIILFAEKSPQVNSTLNVHDHPKKKRQPPSSLTPGVSLTSLNRHHAYTCTPVKRTQLNDKRTKERTIGTYNTLSELTSKHTQEAHLSTIIQGFWIHNYY